MIDDIRISLKKVLEEEILKIYKKYKWQPKGDFMMITEKMIKKTNKKSIAVNKLGSIFHISLKNLSGYILVSKHRVCCLDFGG